MNRTCVLLCLCLLAAVPATASASEKTAAPARPYVETSYVIAPRSVGDFTLVRSSLDPDNRLAGASLLYRAKDHPEATINLYIYAAGRLDPDTAVIEGMQAFGEGMKHAVKDGTYSRQQTLGPADAFRLTPAPPPAAANDEEAVMRDAIANAGGVNGQKLRMELHRAPGDAPLRSNAYLFYKQLYYVKVRISAAQPDIGAEAFDALADQATRALVPAVQVENVGGCAAGAIQVDSNASDTQMMHAIARQLSQQQGYHCHVSASTVPIEERRATADVIEIAYDADDWKSQ